jgi:antagonist of KipI
MTIRVLRAGMLTCVQDLGRYGYAHLGISPAGAADAVSFRLANMLVGNAEDAPALEMTVIGGHFIFEKPAVVAITGADVSFQCSSKLPMWEAVEIAAGAEINCGPLANGVRSYLAVRGGVAVPAILGSSSTQLSGAFGGFKGRALKNGDLLETGASGAGSRVRLIKREAVLEINQTGPIRVTKGPQCDWFSDETHQTFLSTTFKVTQQSNRAGLRLAGADIRAQRTDELLTEGVSLGAVQVPSNGQPIILFVDQQATGGYPKIANVIAADLHRVGQMRPADDVQFELVEVGTALELLREQERLIRKAIES